MYTESQWAEIESLEGEIESLQIEIERLEDEGRDLNLDELVSLDEQLRATKEELKWVRKQ